MYRYHVCVLSVEIQSKMPLRAKRNPAAGMRQRGRKVNSLSYEPLHTLLAGRARSRWSCPLLSCIIHLYLSYDRVNVNLCFNREGEQSPQKPSAILPFWILYCDAISLLLTGFTSMRQSHEIHDETIHDYSLVTIGIAHNLGGLSPKCAHHLG